VLASRKFADQCRPARIWAVLPRATTSPRERVQTLANAARVWGVKLLQRRQNREAAANACERRCRLDKLGVTASSPVPPILYPLIVKSLVTATWPSRETRHAYLPGAKPVELGASFQAHTGQRVSAIRRPAPHRP
jgi:hypothetical protein